SSRTPPLHICIHPFPPHQTPALAHPTPILPARISAITSNFLIRALRPFRSFRMRASSPSRRAHALLGATYQDPERTRWEARGRRQTIYVTARRDFPLGS